MTSKEILEKLKATFAEMVNGEPMPAEPTAPVPAKAKLKDGTEVEVTVLEVGGIVTINGQPAPVGDHTLEDGTVITLGDNGVITAIVPAPGTPEAEDMSAKFSAFETATNEKFASYESKFAEFETKLKRANKVIEGLMELTQTLAEQPTGTPDPITSPATKFSAETEVKTKNFSLLFS